VLFLVNAMQCISLPHITASVFINDGRLDLSPWEQIFWASRIGWHASLDGRRRKRVLVKIIGE